MRISDWSSDVCSSDLYLLAIFVICAAPFVLGTLAYYFFPTAARTNYGDLLPPQPVPELTLVAPEGKPLTMSQLRGKRSEERRAGNACVSSCRYRSSPYHYKISNKHTCQQPQTQ